MQVIIIRHAKAEDRGATSESSSSEAKRALTRNGRQYARLAGRVLCRLRPGLDGLAASPLLRAQETAELIAKQFKNIHTTCLPALAPGGSAADVMQWLSELDPHAAVGLVGHEPDLSRLVGWMLAGTKQSVIELKKGAICLIEFNEAPEPGRGLLRWALAPSQIRSLHG